MLLFYFFYFYGDLMRRSGTSESSLSPAVLFFGAAGLRDRRHSSRD